MNEQRRGKQTKSGRPKMFHRVSRKVKMKAVKGSWLNIFTPSIRLFLFVVACSLTSSCPRPCDTSRANSTRSPQPEVSYLTRPSRQIEVEPAYSTTLDLLSSSNQHRPRQPEFNLSQESLVIGSRWQTEVFLPCKILGLDEDQTVSWIRQRDSLVITIDKLRLVDDHRFQLAHAEHDWTLVLSQPNNSDAGFYECQVSSMEPKLSRLIELRMVEANSFISNVSSPLIVRPNESVNVTCTIEAPKQTDFVYWYKNKEPIQFDNLKQRYQAAGSAGSSGVARNSVRAKRRADIKAAQDKDQEEKEGEEEDDEDSERKKKNHKEDESELGNSSHFLRNMTAAGMAANRRKGPPGEANDMTPARQENRSRLKPQVKLMKSSSSLIIKRSSLNDTANYTCLPSNAKPSHISIYVIENGAQSQPEKRSLQATDGAISSILELSSHKRPFLSLFELLVRKLEASFGDRSQAKFLPPSDDLATGGDAKDSFCAQLLDSISNIKLLLMMVSTAVYLAQIMA